MKRSSARPEDELPTLAYVGIAGLMMAAAWSVLFIAWPYLVDQVPPPQRLLGNYSPPHRWEKFNLIRHMAERRDF